MGLIYMRISPSGGKYIGKTCGSEEKRWQDHCSEAHSIKHHAYDILLNKAIRKYGDNNFTVKILEENIPEEKIEEREKYWINFYHTYYLDNCHGYNMTRGGEGRSKISQEEILKLWEEDFSAGEIANKLNVSYVTVSKHLKGFNISTDEIIKRGHKVTGDKTSIRFLQLRIEKQEIVLKLWEQGYTLQKIADELDMSYETLIKIVNLIKIPKNEITQRGKDCAKNTLINNFKNNPQTLKIIELWEQGYSPGEIMNSLQITKDIVTRALNYYNIDKTERLHRGAQNANKIRCKPILQYDLNNNLIREWLSAQEAGRILNFDASTIRKCCNGKVKTYKKFIWKNKESIND